MKVEWKFDSKNLAIGLQWYESAAFPCDDDFVPHKNRLHGMAAKVEAVETTWMLLFPMLMIRWVTSAIVHNK